MNDVFISNNLEDMDFSESPLFSALCDSVVAPLPSGPNYTLTLVLDTCLYQELNSWLNHIISKVCKTQPYPCVESQYKIDTCSYLGVYPMGFEISRLDGAPVATDKPLCNATLTATFSIDTLR